MKTISSIALILRTWISVIALNARDAFAETFLAKALCGACVSIIAEGVIWMVELYTAPSERITGVESAGLIRFLITNDFSSFHHFTNGIGQSGIAKEISRAEITASW